MMGILASGVGFLKLVMSGAFVTLGVQLACDEDVQKLGKKVFKIGAVKKIKRFPLDNEHTTVLGITRHGKTYATVKTLEQETGAVFFWNVQEEKVKGFIKADKSNNIEQLSNALKSGKKINYVPSGDMELDSKIFGLIVEEFYKKNVSCKMVIDEVHLFDMTKDKGGKMACRRLATTGLRRNLPCVFISQRPALIDNTLVTQSTQHILFALGDNDTNYLKNMGLPVEKIKEATGQEKYRFCVYDLKEVKGAFMIE
jgi:hypothetical protein